MDATFELSWVLLFGFALKISGFMVRDELWLRVLVTGGIFCDMIFFGLLTDPLLQPLFANVVLVSINIALVVRIISERTTWRMGPDDLALFSQFPTFSPGQFRRLRRDMSRVSEPAGTQIAWEGRPVEDLMLVFSDRILIGKSGAAFPVAGPTFVGEIAFLTGNPSSADVTLPDGGTVVRIPMATLRARMARKPALANAIIALFGAELARKVTDSVPMDRAARVRAPTSPTGQAVTTPVAGT